MFEEGECSNSASTGSTGRLCIQACSVSYIYHIHHSSQGLRGKVDSKVLTAALLSLVPPPVYFVMEHGQRMLLWEALLLLAFHSLRLQASKNQWSVEVVS